MGASSHPAKFSAPFTSLPYQGSLTNEDDPLGVPRVRASIECDPLPDPWIGSRPPGCVDAVMRINAAENEGSGVGEWLKVKVSIDNFAALSVTPPGVFPQSIEVTPQVGE